MSVPQSSGPRDPKTEFIDEKTLTGASADDEQATLIEAMAASRSAQIAEQTIVEPSELEQPTIINPPSPAEATIIEPSQIGNSGTTVGSKSLDNPESALQTVIDAAVSKKEDLTFQATAGSSSAARGWAPTKGASAGEWPGQPSARPKPSRPQNAPRAEDRYRLIDNFAHGGLGNIWLAEDTSIHRQVAFKELLPRALNNRVIVERFLEEAQITGQLEHPGIVPIYDVGFQENGTPFYAMKLLKGGNMEKAIEAMHALPRDSTERQLAFTRLLRQFIAVCQAVGFAHDKGVLHRDLKPLNVMLGEFGETLVLDWGLAKLVDVLGEHEIATDSGGRLDNADPNASLDSGTLAEPQTLEANTSNTRAAHSGVTATCGATSPSATSASGTQAAGTEPATFFRRQVATDARTVGSQTIMGQVMGTPAYMPPEQAQGLIAQLDARTDIYSLGAILYKLLTNEPPVPRGRAPDVIAKVIAGQIKPPREIDPTVPPPLEAICRKAMAQQQADRYTKALDLAADVEAWLADEPVSVYPDSLKTQFRRWRKRHRTAVISASSVLALLVFGSLLWVFIETNRIGNLQTAAETKVTEARLSTAKSDFAKATTLLAEALGQVRAESRLVQLRNRIQSDLDNISRLTAAAERERISELRAKATRLLDDAMRATDAANDFVQARALLTEAATLLANESSLSDVHRQAQTRLSEVNESLAEQSKIAAAKAQLAKFQEAVEQVRVFSGNLSGEDSVDDLRDAHRQSLAAMKLLDIDFDHPDQIDPRLQLLGLDATDRWRIGVSELLFTIAQAETNLAMKDQPNEVRAAAERSLGVLRKAGLLGYDAMPVWLLKADLFTHLGRDEEAQMALAEAERHPPRSRLDHYLLAENARRSRHFKKAIHHLQNALRVEPNDFWSINLMGVCHLNLGQPQAAAAEFTACIAQQPQLVWPYVSRGTAFADFQEFENAHRDLAKALELDPQSYPALLNRGFVNLLQKDFGAAQADFQRCAELRPNLSAPHWNLAEVHRQLAMKFEETNTPDSVLRASSEREQTLAELTKALSLAPQQAVLYHLRGEVQAKLNATADALADFQKAIKLEANPRRRALSWREIGLIHIRANRLQDSLAALDQSLTENPDDAHVIRQRAEVLNALGKFPETIEAFTAFLEKEGPVGDVYRARGLAYAKTNKYREAINDYTMSLQYEPSPNMLKQRGKAYLLQATALAKEDFEEALRLNPEDPDTHQSLAYALVTLGNHAGAVAEIEKVSAAAKRATERLGSRAWPLFFNPATTYSQAYAKALIDPQLTAERREELAAKYAARAVELLVEAHRVAGMEFRAALLKEIHSDEALNPIRQRAEFLEAMKMIDPR